MEVAEFGGGVQSGLKRDGHPLIVANSMTTRQLSRLSELG
jgi:hypothetical protein